MLLHRGGMVLGVFRLLVRIELAELLRRFLRFPRCQHGYRNPNEIDIFCGTGEGVEQ